MKTFLKITAAVVFPSLLGFGLGIALFEGFKAVALYLPF